MLTRLRQVFAAPVFEDDGTTRAASLLNTTLLTLFVVSVLAPPLLVLVEPTGVTFTLLAGAIVAILAVGLLVLTRRGRVQAASLLLSSMLFAIVTSVAYAFGIRYNYGVTAYFLVIVMAGLLMGGRAAIILGLLSMLATAAVFYAEARGAIVFAKTAVGVADLIIVVASLGLTSLLLRFAVRGIAEGFERARRNAQALAESNRELQASRDTLQAQARDLTRRTRHLEATAEVARDAASVLDPQELLAHVVNLVSGQFDLYHAGIFLLDLTSEWAVLQAASSAGGQRMLARGHRLRVGEEGIVGYVTGQGRPRIALDVGDDAVFFENPDLPDTRSEIALPLRARGEVIGALDVQSTEPEAFTEEDVAVLQTLADQVAVAISNARLFQQAEESLAAEQRAYGELSRQAWRELLRTQADLGFLRDERGVFPTGGVWRPGMEAAVRTGQATLDEGNATSLAMPVKVRGHVIGVIDAHKPDGAGAWTPEQIALLRTLSDQLGVALESARLYQDAQRRAARDRLTGEITDRMRRTPNMDELMKTTIQELSAVLGTSRIFVQLSTLPDPAEAGAKNATPPQSEAE
jgi:GAF domain-containing protein